jgi:hypothetical protein
MSSPIFKANHFYHQTTKSFIVSFGELFSNISIEKYQADGTKAQTYEVPIDFSPKNKWLIMIGERPDYTTNQVQMTLPRLAFEITSMTPNMARKIGFNGTYSIANVNGGGQTKIYNPVPYDLTVNLYAITKDNEDMLQIIEQIIPFFQPTLVLNLNLLPEYNVYKDIPISLMNVTTEDSYNGSTEDQRFINTTFTFNVPLFYFGPISDKTKEIKDAKVAVTTNQGKLENYEAVVNPITASKQAVHTIVETWKQ